ncbi:MAG: hypothetical protein AABZ08_03260 [Planctomycetota bacterium]
MAEAARENMSGQRPTVPTWLVPGFILFCLVYPRHDFAYYSNVNESARIYLVMAAVDHRVLQIDESIKQFGDVHDKAEHGGHFYCDKPIGLSLLAVPVYGVMKVVGAVMGHGWTLGELRYIFTVVCVSLPTVLLCIGLRRYWRELTGDALLVEFAILAYALGTIAFTYSTQFMGHQLAAVLAGAHFLLARRVTNRTGWRIAATMGLLAGLGAITDYFSSFLHLFIILGYVRRMRPWSVWAGWLLAGVVGVAPLLIYNTICFGGPLTIAYAYESLGVFKESHSTGFMGVTFPRLESMWGLLFSASKGLFYLSPFLVFALLGIGPGLRSREWRGEWIVILLGVVTIMYLAMSLLVWRAGRTIGPRHMVSMLPLLMTLVVMGVSRRPMVRPWFVGLTILGTAIIGISTMTLPGFEENFENPFASQAMFLLGRGWVSPNLGQAIGLRGVWSLVPLALVFGGLLVYLTRTMNDAKRRLFTWSRVGAMALSIGWFGFVARHEPDHPALLTLLQGRTLGLLGEFRDSSVFLERAIDLNPSQDFLQESVPQLLVNYQQLGDQRAVQRLEAKVRRIESGEVQPSH